MKAKYVWAGIATLIALGGIGLGRCAWRAHRNLVTLHVRNAPLAEVIRKIEWQTWKRIRADKRFDTGITLDVKDQPLASVLDRLALQCGARWTTLYAVYGSRRALRKLESALSGEQKLDQVGWKTIAPDGLTNPVPGRTGGGMVKMVRKDAKGGNMTTEEEVWSPVELVLEAQLNSRLSTNFNQFASSEGAAEAARQLKGSVQTYYVLRPSTMGMGFSGPPFMISRFGSRRQFGDQPTTPGDTNATRLLANTGPSAADLEAAMRQRRLEEFGKLTPEQRVRQARQRQTPVPH